MTTLPRNHLAVPVVPQNTSVQATLEETFQALEALDTASNEIFAAIDTKVHRPSFQQY